MMNLENKIALVTGSARGIGARIFTEVIGQPFSYEARLPKEFYRNVLAAGAEPSYMKCVFDSYTDFTAGRIPHSDDVFDNLPAIAGKKADHVSRIRQKALR